MFELASILILGVMAQWFSWRIKVPAILPLIIIGLLVGPLSTLFSSDGTKWIEPMYNESTQSGIFPGQILFYFVSLSIGVILFEGGLTLKKKEIKGVGPVIIKLISVGSLITFIFAALAVHFLMGLNWSLSFLFSSLIIVTGPTVIAPILRNIPLSRNVATVLKWEGILIDPIGALVAVLVFEFIVSGGGGSYTATAFIEFGKIILVGTSIGFTAAYFLFYLLKKKLIPHYLLNVFTLGLVLLVFVASDALSHESGLLSVVVMGMVLGNLDVDEIKGILDFKESISVLLISLLFILLAANINMSELELLLDWKVLFLFLIVIFFIRPFSVFMSSSGSELRRNEKLFVSWVGPRGIVAAGIASLFGMRLSGVIQGAEYITPLVFMIVLGTVLFNAATARWVASKLGVILKDPEGVMIIGANKASRLISKYLVQNGRHVVLIDTNRQNIEKAQEIGVEGYVANVYTDDLSENIEFNDIAFVLGMTASPDVNSYVINKFRKDFGEKGAYRLTSTEEINDPNITNPEGVFGANYDFFNFNEIVREYPDIHELAISSPEFYKEFIEELYNEPKSIPLFIKKPTGKIIIMPGDPFKIEISDVDRLIYMGKKLHDNGVEELTAPTEVEKTEETID